MLIAAFLTPSNAFCETIRIATYNVNFDNREEEGLIGAIVASKADVVCFQETTSRSRRIIRDCLSRTHPVFHSQGQFAFASKLEVRQLESDHRRFLTATFQGRDQEFLIANIHLAPVVLPKNPGFLDVVNAITASEKRHEAEIAEVAKWIKPSVATLVVGDYNSLSQSAAPSVLRENGLTDSYAAVHADADLHPTWDLRTMLELEPHVYQENSLGVLGLMQPMQLGLRVDFIFHSRHFRTTDSEIIKRPGSDHFLVVSELELDDPAHASESAAGVVRTYQVSRGNSQGTD